VPRRRGPWSASPRGGTRRSGIRQTERWRVRSCRAWFLFPALEDRAGHASPLHQRLATRDRPEKRIFNTRRGGSELDHRHVRLDGLRRGGVVMSVTRTLSASCVSAISARTPAALKRPARGGRRRRSRRGPGPGPRRRQSPRRGGGAGSRALRPRSREQSVAIWPSLLDSCWWGSTARRPGCVPGVLERARLLGEGGAGEDDIGGVSA
jgi:hypothetical protein